MANPLDEVDGRVSALLDMVQAGMVKADELSWVDFKQMWKPILDDEVERAEFFKDTCALANVGQDAFMIFGANNDGHVIQGAPFTASGYKNPSGLEQLLDTFIAPSIGAHVRRLDREVEGSRVEISYLYIRATHNRPHFVNKWRSGDKGAFTKNAFFWRSGTHAAGLNDGQFPDRVMWDSMYCDRPGSFSSLRTRRWEGEIVAGWTSQIEGKRGVSVPFQVSNLGTLQTAIVEMKVDGTVSLADGPSVPLGSSLVLSFKNKKKEDDRLPLHVPPGESQPFHALLHVDPELIEIACGSGKRRFELTVVLTDIHDHVYPDLVKWDEPAQE